MACLLQTSHEKYFFFENVDQRVEDKCQNNKIQLNQCLFTTCKRRWDKKVLKLIKNPNLNDKNSEIPNIDMIHNPNPNLLFYPKSQSQEV